VYGVNQNSLRFHPSALPFQLTGVPKCPIEKNQQLLLQQHLLQPSARQPYHQWFHPGEAPVIAAPT
jgi:hypothetical protein